MAKKEDVFQRAQNLAKKSTMINKHGAVITKNGRIIGEGYNHYSSYMSHNYSVHAEMAALLNVPKRKKNRKYLEEATMIVVRVAGKDFHCSLSKPCFNCQQEIAKAGIKRTFYSQ